MEMLPIGLFPRPIPATPIHNDSGQVVRVDGKGGFLA